jgi:hypothetical protein
MYVIMNAVPRSPNDPELDASAVEALMRIGGDFAHPADALRRLSPDSAKRTLMGIRRSDARSGRDLTKLHL